MDGSDSKPQLSEILSASGERSNLGPSVGASVLASLDSLQGLQAPIMIHIGGTSGEDAMGKAVLNTSAKKFDAQAHIPKLVRKPLETTTMAEDDDFIGSLFDDEDLHDGLSAGEGNGGDDEDDQAVQSSLAQIRNKKKKGKGAAQALKAPAAQRQADTPSPQQHRARTPDYSFRTESPAQLVEARQQYFNEMSQLDAERFENNKQKNQVLSSVDGINTELVSNTGEYQHFFETREKIRAGQLHAISDLSNMALTPFKDIHHIVSFNLHFMAEALGMTADEAGARAVEVIDHMMGGSKVLETMKQKLYAGRDMHSQMLGLMQSKIDELDRFETLKAKKMVEKAQHFHTRVVPALKKHQSVRASSPPLDADGEQFHSADDQEPTRRRHAPVRSDSPPLQQAPSYARKAQQNRQVRAGSPPPAQQPKHHVQRLQDSPQVPRRSHAPKPTSSQLQEHKKRAQSPDAFHQKKALAKSVRPSSPAEQGYSQHQHNYQPSSTDQSPHARDRSTSPVQETRRSRSPVRSQQKLRSESPQGRGQKAKQARDRSKSPAGILATHGHRAPAQTPPQQRRHK